MGTLSKRPLSDFGDDIKERIEGFRTHVGRRIDRFQDDVRTSSVHSITPMTWFALAVGVAIGSLATLAFYRAVAK